MTAQRHIIWILIRNKVYLDPYFWPITSQQLILQPIMPLIQLQPISLRSMSFLLNNQHFGILHKCVAFCTNVNYRPMARPFDIFAQMRSIWANVAFTHILWKMTFCTNAKHLGKWHFAQNARGLAFYTYLCKYVKARRALAFCTNMPMAGQGSKK